MKNEIDISDHRQDFLIFRLNILKYITTNGENICNIFDKQKVGVFKIQNLFTQLKNDIPLGK